MIVHCVNYVVTFCALAVDGFLVYSINATPTSIAHIVQIAGSKKHIPIYLNTGAIYPTATNLEVSSIILADSGTIFLPIPCNVLLSITNILNT